MDGGLALGLALACLVAMSAVGVWFSRGRVGSVEDFVSARDSAGTGTTTATLIASAMGVWIFLSPAEAGAAFGGVSAVTGYGVGAMLPMAAFAVLGPRIRELVPAGHSLTEYALARYGAGTYLLVLVVTVLYMFIFLAAEFTAIAQAFAMIAGVPRWQTASLVGAFVLLYTGYGGLRASIVTDTVQTLVILPLLALSAAGAVVALGGPGAVHEQVVAADPTLLDPTFGAGLQFGVWVSVAILGAELLNQSWWQRIYAARDGRTLRRGFLVAAVANATVVFLAGLFGIVARGYVDLGVTGEGPYRAGVAFFVLLTEAFPPWLVLAIVLLALLLVMSTTDTLFNALASVVTADLPRVVDAPTDRQLTLAARGLTVVVAVAAVLVSLRARSVLALFLFADLLGAAMMVPLFAGLYSRRLAGRVAGLAGLAGIAVGLAYFPTPVVRSVVTAIPVVGGALPAPSYLWAFLGAAATSTLVVALGAGAYDADYPLGRLATAVTRLEGDGGDRGIDEIQDGDESRDGDGGDA